MCVCVCVCVCVCALPLPPNAGRTIFKSSPQLNKLMREAAAIINIAAHRVGRPAAVMLHSCTDIEGHEVRHRCLRLGKAR